MANIYSGIIKKEAIADGRGQSYKIRLTNQIRNLIKNADSTNVKLGPLLLEIQIQWYQRS
jgi:hypothetical protein